MAADISIIIPNNNSLHLLRRMISSIPEREEYEIIVIDNSIVPLDDHAIIAGRNNVSVYHSAPSRGAGGARNEGLKHATGKWLLFADADDFFLPDAFNNISGSLASDCDIIYFGWTSCYSDTLQPANRNYVINQYIEAFCQRGDDTQLRYFWDSPCGKLIKRSLVSQSDIKFDECPAGNDMGFSVRVGTFAGKVKAIDTPIYCVTIHDGSITHVRSRRNIESRFKAAVRLNCFLKSQHLKQHRHSVMRLWLQSWKSSPLLALKLLAHSTMQGNSIFIGCSRWLSTTKMLIKHKPKV